MQGLASYGSDSDEEAEVDHSISVPSSSTLLQNNLKTTIDTSSTTVPPPPPSLNRVKNTLTSTSRGHSPLSGVRLPPSSNAASPSNSRTPNIVPTSTTSSPNQRGKQRASSASPPPYTNTNRNSDSLSQVEGINSKASVEVESSTGVRVMGASSLPIGVRLDSLKEFGIPEMVLGPCNPAVEAKLANFHHLALTRGLHFNDSLSASKAFRNPRIYTKLVALVGVNETNSGWDKSIWDPHGLNSNATASRIASAQSARSEAKAAQPAGNRSSIAFSSSASTSTNSNSSTNPYSTSTSYHHSNSNRGDEQARIRESMSRKSESSSSGSGRDRDKDKGRERDKDGGSGRSETKSRWDTGTSSNSKRDRSRSPRRR